MLQVRNMFTWTWLICYNIALDMEFPKVLGLAFILYSVSIKDFMNSWPMNSDPWLYMISIGLGYLDSYIFSTKFAIDIDILLFYCVFTNHPVIVSIIVTDFICNFYFCPFLCTT